jgi:hypothetical protein
VVSGTLGQQLLDLGDDLRDAAHVRIDAQGPAEVVERPLRLIEPQVDLPVAGQGPEVGGVALHDLVAVVERLLVLAHQEVDGRALVPGLGEVGLSLDDAAEGLHRARPVAAVHLLQADLELRVDVLVAGAAPHLPHRLLGEDAHHLVGIGQRPEERRRVGGAAELAQPRGGAAAQLEVLALDLGQRLLAREGDLGLGSRGVGEEAQGQGAGGDEPAGAHHDRATSLRKASSSSVVTPRRLASSAFEPASSPTTT